MLAPLGGKNYIWQHRFLWDGKWYTFCSTGSCDKRWIELDSDGSAICPICNSIAFPQALTRTDSDVRWGHVYIGTRQYKDKYV